MTKARILYAEDDEGCARSLVPVLELSGWEVDVARDGQEAMERWRERRPDVLLLDLEMPRMNGWEVIQQVRERDKETPIVVYSGVVASQGLIEAIEAGATDVIRKGEEPPLLLAKLKAIYERMVAQAPSAHVYLLTERTKYNSESRRLVIGDNELVLKETEGRLLKLLCMKCNLLAEKEFLIAGLWGRGNAGKERQLSKYISRLRQCIKQDEHVTIASNREGYSLLTE